MRTYFYEITPQDVRIFAKESDYGFKDYSPTHARFITEDPIRDGENWFAYVRNNPVNWVDPWGLSASDGQKNGSTGEQILDNIQTTLNIAGLIPGAGEVADVANGFISLARGNYIDAALSFISVVPVIGDTIGKGGKTARFIEKSSGKGANTGHQKSLKSSPASNVKAQKNTNKLPHAAGRMNVEVEKGQAPKTIEHVHKGRGTYEKDHVHFTDGTALNNDGTWKHGEHTLTNNERKWLDQHNWILPE